MAKTSIDTDATGIPVHGRTTANTVISQTAVLGIDGSDSVVPADPTFGLKTETSRISPLATETITRVTSSASSVTLAASNTARRTLTIFNESTSVLYLKPGSSASVTSYKVQIGPGGYYEYPLPMYQGTITGIWATANGAAMVVEGT